MKKTLEKILDKDQRSIAWFWKNHVGLDVCSYQHFMNMLDGRAKMREDIRYLIFNFISGNINGN